MIDILINIFGDTENKENNFNKIYEVVIKKKPIITGQSNAIKELFENRKNILMCKFNDPKDLVDKILELKNNEYLRKKIAKEAREMNKILIAKYVIKELVEKIIK